MGSEKKKYSIGDALRERSRDYTPDIGDIWEEQKKIRKENHLLELQYKESKEKARKLKKEIRLNQIGKADSIVDSVGDKAKKAKIKFKRVIKKALSSKLAGSSKKSLKNVPKTRRRTAFLAVLTLIVLAGFVISRRGDSPPSDTLGQSTEENSQTSNTPTELITESPSFSLLFPPNKNQQNTEIVRISPQEAVPAYAFIDNYQEATLQVSQQELPDNFKQNLAQEMQKVAESFQATSVIEVNGNKIYHGFNENNGGIQSIVFTKGERLFLVSSSKKLSDDLWVSYYLSLK